MNFTEKLKRLTAGENKAKLSKQAGLPSTGISNYISRKYVPRADTALAISRALKVPLDWLVDEKQDWPPPLLDPDQIWMASDHDLMREVCRRFRLVALRFYDDLARVSEIDWLAVAGAIRKTPDDEPLTAPIAWKARLPASVSSLSEELLRFDPSIQSISFHDELPGRDMDPDELMVDRLLTRYREIRQRLPGFDEVRNLNSSRVVVNIIGRIIDPKTPAPPPARRGKSKRETKR